MLLGQNSCDRQLSYFDRRLQSPSIGCLSESGQSRVRSCTDNGFGFYYARPVTPLRNNSLPRLTEQGSQKINDLARRYGVIVDAVMTLLQALLNSNGEMAQFDHRELGGAGQWMPGGMTMVGDMFNQGLKAKVDGLCSELSQILAMHPFVPFPGSFQSQSQRQGGSQQEGGHVGHSFIGRIRS